MRRLVHEYLEGANRHPAAFVVGAVVGSFLGAWTAEALRPLLGLG